LFNTDTIIKKKTLSKEEDGGVDQWRRGGEMTSYGATNRADGERATIHLPFILLYTPHTTDLYNFLALTFFIKKYFIFFVRSPF